MNIRLLFACVFAVSAVCAMGSIGNPTYTAAWGTAQGYINLTADDSNADDKQSWTAPYKWPNEDDPDPGKDYFVPYNRRIGAKRGVGEAGAAELPFRGRSVRIAGEIYNWASSGSWINLGSNVTLFGGVRLYWNSVGSVTGSSVKLENSSNEWPVKFEYSARNEATPYTVYFRPAVEADADQVLVWTRTADGSMGARFIPSASWPKFYGTLHMAGKNNTFAPPMFSVPGSVIVEDGAVLMPTEPKGTSEIGSLKVAAGATVGFSAVAGEQTFSIANRLELEEGAIVKGARFKDFINGTPPVFPVFTLSQGAVAAGVPDMDKVVCDSSEATYAWLGLPRNIRFVSTDLVDGGAQLGVTYDEVVTITNNMSYNSTPFLWTEGKADQHHPAHFLSDGQPFHDVDYFASGKNCIMWVDVYPYVFPGRSWSMNGGALGIYGNFTCNDWVLGNQGRTRLMSADKTYHIAGAITVRQKGSESYSWRFANADKNTLYIDSSISGTGVIEFNMDTEVGSSKWTTAAYKAYTMGVDELTGDNSGFKGRFRVYCWQSIDATESKYAIFLDDPFVPGPNSNITLRVSSPENLGGTMDAFTYNALAIENECRLVLKETATFDEATRGWYFPANAYLKVESEKTATVKQTLTFGDGAKLVKEGAGTLMLGGTPAVDEGATARPLLQVAEGGLGFASTTALAGIDAAFATGTKLVVDVKPADADFAAKGLVPGDSTLTLPATLPVAFAAEDLQRDESASLGVVTVATQEAADALAARLVFGRVAHHRVVKSVRANGDGTFTVAADIEPAGFALIVR